MSVLVTDSTSSIPAAQAAQWGITVVPMQIKIGEHVRAEPAVPKDVLVRALEQDMTVPPRRPTRPASPGPTRTWPNRGADEIVSVHISGHQSKTDEVARRRPPHSSPIPVHVSTRTPPG